MQSNLHCTLMKTPLKYLPDLQQLPFSYWRPLIILQRNQVQHKTEVTAHPQERTCVLPFSLQPVLTDIIRTSLSIKSVGKQEYLVSVKPGSVSIYFCFHGKFSYERIFFTYPLLLLLFLHGKTTQGLRLPWGNLVSRDDPLSKMNNERSQTSLINHQSPSTFFP